MRERRTMALSQIPSPVGSACHSLAPRLEPDAGASPSLVVVGAVSASMRTWLRAATRDAELVFVEAGSEDEVSALLAVRPPRAVAFAADDPDSRRLCGMVRCDPRNAGIALFALAEDADTATFQRVLSWGANEVIGPARTSALTRALVALEGVPVTGNEPRGRAVVAHADENERIVLAAAVASAGFTVTLAADAASLFTALARAPAALVVAGAGSSHDPLVQKLTDARAEGDLTPWVLSLPPECLRGARSLTATLPHVAVHDASTPPDGVLFLLNELSSEGFVEARASTRVLFATTVELRGLELDLTAFTYNVSEGGLFARTLTPLPSGAAVTLELLAPGTCWPVHINARIAWQRPFGPLSRAVCPPGVGLAFTGGDPAEVGLWRHACIALARGNR